MQVARTSPAVKHRSQFLEVTVAGTPYEMGVQYGEKAKSAVRHSAEYWYAQLAGATERSPDEMVENVKKSSDVAFKFFPELGEEISGTSKGSGVALDDILVATFNNAVTSARFAMGCSNFAARGEATADGDPILGRNLDFDYAVRDDIVLVRAKPKDGNSWLGSRYGALIGVHEGINDKGVAGGWASVMQKAGERVDGMAFMQALQAAFLKTDSVEDAANTIARMPKCTGGNYTFASKDACLVVEGGSKSSQIRREEGDIVLGTNHWRTDDMVERQGVNKFEVGGSTFCPRYVHGDRFLQSRRGKLAVEDFQEMLSSHQSPPAGMTGICAHKDIFGGTICSSVSLPTKGMIYYARGHPCSNTYETFKLAAA